MIDEAAAKLPNVGPYRPMPMENMFTPFFYSGIVKTLLFAAVLPYSRYVMDAHMIRPDAADLHMPFPPLPDAMLPRIAILIAPAVCAALGVVLGLITVRYGAAHADRHRDEIARGAIFHSLWRSGDSKVMWIVLGPWIAGFTLPLIAAIVLFLTGASLWTVLSLIAIYCGHLITARAFRPAFQRIDERVAQLLPDQKATT